MDKAWVHLPRPLPAYGAGATAFVASAMEKLGNPPKIQCPCTRCRNHIYQTSDDVVSHLVMFGMDATYTTWFFHGEEFPSTSSKKTCEREEIPVTYRMFVDAHINEEEIADYTEERRDGGFSKLLEEAETPLYPCIQKKEKKESPDAEIRRHEVWCKAHTKKNGDVPTNFISECVSKIKEINSSQTSPGNSLSITQDALSQTLGPERNGRVRGMGFGITPSQLGARIYSSKKVEVLENQLSIMTNKLTNLENVVMQMQLASKGNEIVNTPSPRSVGSSHVGGTTNLNARDAPINANVGRKCKLVNWQRTAVAKAEVASMDPNDMVHFVPLGKDVWKVWVLVCLDPKAPLWRPNSEMSVIEDAVGSTVAWHKDFITFD